VLGCTIFYRKMGTMRRLWDSEMRQQVCAIDREEGYVK